MEKKELKGIVGIFDALGVKNFNRKQIDNYIDSQQVLLQGIKDKTESQIETRDLPTPDVFAFNDTIIVAIPFNKDEYNCIKGFCVIARKFIIEGLEKGILYRGAISIGTYTLSTAHNIIMGEAISDAASWYEEPQLIGGFTTPKATIYIDRFYDKDQNPPYHFLFKHRIKFKQKVLEAYGINWPKVFFVKKIKPELCKENQEKEYFFEKLSNQYIPIGSEEKYFNSIEFFTRSQELLPKGD